MVADDEKWVRTTITSIIPYEQLGLTLVSEASNGLEALELCRQHKPDILVTDLMMPGLTGMELIQELRSCLPDMKIIIISGYNDFEYAKTAIKYGVSEYILKPVDESELYNVLSRVRDELLENYRRQDEEIFIRRQYKRALPIISSDFLNQLIHPNSMLADSINKELLKYNINFSAPNFTIVLFSPDNISSLTDGGSHVLFKTLVRRVMRHFTGGMAFPRISNEYEMVAIINHDNPDGRNYVSKALHICISLFRKHFTGTLSIGVSSTAHHIKKLPDLFEQACEALDERFWKSGPGIFLFQNKISSEFQHIDIPSHVMENIVLGIRFSDCQPAFLLIDDIYMSIKAQQNVRSAPIKEFYWSLIQSIIAALNMQMSFIEYESLLSNAHPYEKVKNMRSLEQLVDYLKEIVEHISDHYNQRSCMGNEGNPIYIARRIIDQNFRKDISLELIAQYVHLSSSYFSELFKKETGMSFIDYKTLLRVEHAKKLLTTNSMSIYEISNSMGYSNSKYFSRLFKKITGMTPYEYKENYISNRK